MKSIALLAVLTFGACAKDPYDPRMEPTYYVAGAKIVGLPSGVVAKLGTERVGIGNTWPRAFTDADGHRVEGPTVTLSCIEPKRGGRILTVGEGSVFQLGGAVWRVLKVKDPPQEGALVERIGP